MVPDFGNWSTVSTNYRPPVESWSMPRTSRERSLMYWLAPLERGPTHCVSSFGDCGRFSENASRQSCTTLPTTQGIVVVMHERDLELIRDYLDDRIACYRLPVCLPSDHDPGHHPKPAHAQSRRIFTLCRRGFRNPGQKSDGAICLVP